jgi:hypothetical protein
MYGLIKHFGLFDGLTMLFRKVPLVFFWKMCIFYAARSFLCSFFYNFGTLVEIPFTSKLESMTSNIHSRVTLHKNVNHSAPKT